tara:strand:+ start:1004 stop:1312 length:309 start_codon:yes stop_codon:yes gene_type:complete
MKDNYRPLPDTLEIKKSEIEGTGVFAAEDIDSGVTLGVSHLVFDDGHLQRTPLGGFYNHSDAPNCVKVMKHEHQSYSSLLLITDRAIKKGEEITVRYTFYKV